MSRGTLVCLTGLDGAGKSTLTEEIVSSLQLNGYDAVGTYGRYLPKLAYPLMEAGRRTMLTDTGMEEDYQEHQSSKKDLFSNPLISFSYEALIMIDYIPQFINRVLIPLYKHDIVICDRYFYDTLLTDLAGDVLESPQEAIDRYNVYSKFLPEVDFEFYIQVDPDISLQRKDDIPSRSYLKERKRFYDAFALDKDMIILDGSEPLDPLKEKVINLIMDQNNPV